MSQNNTEYIDCFSEYTKYFLACEKDWAFFDFDECSLIFIKIFNEILFENDEVKRNKQISYLIFWTNFIIEKCNRNVKEPLLTTIITIVGKLDLHQLIQYAASEHDMDFSSKIDYETRKIFDENMALTDAQIEILLSIFQKKDIVFSAPTSYGKTGVVKKALLLSLEKGLINNFVAILPTNALINEYRKSINNYFKEKQIDVSIIEGPYVKPNTTKTVFLFTQERFLIFNNLFKDFTFDYILFDEAQNVINSIKKTENHREVLLAKCIAIADSLGVPKIFLMPYIKEPYTSFISNFVNLNAENLTVIDDVFSPTSSLKYLIKKIDNKFKLYDVTFHKGFSDTPKEIEMDISDINPNTIFESIKYDLYKICDSKEINCLKEKNLFYCNNYAWILHMLSHLKPLDGVAGFLLANGALGDSDTVDIREQLIKNDKVEAIIILPRELFITTDISVTLWILNQNKKGGNYHGRNLRNREHEILFMDLRRWTENPVKNENKKKVRLIDEQIQRAADIYHTWQNEGTDGTNYEVPELYRSVGIEEIKENSWSLVPSKYIEFIDHDLDIDFNVEMSRIQQEMKDILAQEKQSQKMLEDAFRGIGYGIE